MKMKNKKSIQAQKKEEHKKQMLEAKKRKRRQEPVLERNEPIKPKKAKFLIFCEGKNTEPSYFNQFKLSNAEIEPIGEGYNTISLVNRAIEIVEQKEMQGKKYNQIWCVFDKDDFSDFDFNEAIRKAEANNMKVAFSNQAFEYWIILHFQDHQGGQIHRNYYDEIINRHLSSFNLSYDGKDSKIITEEIFELLQSIPKNRKRSRQKNAIIRAKRIYEEKKNESPAKTESNTSVYKLIEQLEKYK